MATREATVGRGVYWLIFWVGFTFAMCMLLISTIAPLNHCLDFGDRLETRMGDNSYKGTFCDVVEECERKFDPPNRAEGQRRFVVEAKRWVVERTFSWLNFFRRLVVEYGKHLRVRKHSFI